MKSITKETKKELKKELKKEQKKDKIIDEDDDFDEEMEEDIGIVGDAVMGVSNKKENGIVYECYNCNSDIVNTLLCKKCGCRILMKKRIEYYVEHLSR